VKVEPAPTVLSTGAAGGVLITVAVSIARGWTPVLDLRLAAGAPALGVAIGLLAGAYPAWKASVIEPIAALHAGQ
jgi:putative ABC transport system permease protein